jgi:hypothetical protein
LCEQGAEQTSTCTARLDAVEWRLATQTEQDRGNTYCCQRVGAPLVVLDDSGMIRNRLGTHSISSGRSARVALCAPPPRNSYSILQNLYDQKVHRVFKCPPLVHNVSQLSPAHSHIPYFCKTHFILIDSLLSSETASFCFRVSQLNHCMCLLLIGPKVGTPRPPHPSP